VRGHPARAHTLEEARIGKAKLLVLADDDELGRRHARVLDGSPAVAEPLGALGLARHGITVDRVLRGGEPVAFDEGFRLRPDDRIEMSGSADAFLTTAPLFRPAGVGLDAHAGAAAGAGGDGEAPFVVRPKVYGADWCALTSGFRTYLDRGGIAYDYHNVERDEAAAEAVRAMNGGKLKFPMVVVGEREMKNPTLDELDAALASAGLVPPP
jgi:mycoredoxin